MKELIETLIVATLALFALFLVLTALKIPLVVITITGGVVSVVSIGCKTYLYSLKLRQEHEIEVIKWTGCLPGTGRKEIECQN